MVSKKSHITKLPEIPLFQTQISNILLKILIKFFIMTYVKYFYSSQTLNVGQTKNVEEKDGWKDEWSS